MRFSAALTSNPLLASKVQTILEGPPDHIAPALSALSVELGIPFAVADFDALIARWAFDQASDTLRRLDLPELIRVLKNSTSAARTRRTIIGAKKERLINH